MTQILRIDSAIWNSSPKMYRDAIMTSGTQYILDCADGESNTASWGNVANGTSIKSLTKSSDSWTVSNPDGDNGVLNYGNQGWRFDNVDGDDGMFDSAFASHYVNGRDFIACVWFRQKAAHYSNANNQAILANATDYNSGTFDISTSNLTPRVAIRGVGYYVFPSEYATALDTIVQIAVARQNDKFLVFRNGILIYSAKATGATLATSNVKDGISKISGQNVNSLLNPFKGEVFRVWKEDLTISNSYAAAQVRKDYELNTPRFI